MAGEPANATPTAPSRSPGVGGGGAAAASEAHRPVSASSPTTRASTHALGAPWQRHAWPCTGPRWLAAASALPSASHAGFPRRRPRSTSVAATPSGPWHHASPGPRAGSRRRNPRTPASSSAGAPTTPASAATPSAASSPACPCAMPASPHPSGRPRSTCHVTPSGAGSALAARRPTIAARIALAAGVLRMRAYAARPLSPMSQSRFPSAGQVSARSTSRSSVASLGSAPPGSRNASNTHPMPAAPFQSPASSSSISHGAAKPANTPENPRERVNR
jgi:hypothetical protein